MQKNNENPPYKISISLEDLMAFVPPSSASIRTGRRIAEFTFEVEMRPLGANKYPLLTAISDSGLINESSVLSLEYLHEQLKRLGFAQSSWSKLEERLNQHRNVDLIGLFCYTSIKQALRC